MTPDDRSKLARIAAWQEFTGHTDAQIEAYLDSVSSGLTQAEIDRAMAEGRAGLNLGGLLNQGTAQDVADFLAANAAEGVNAYAVVARYQTGGNVREDWRSVSLTVYGAKALADIALSIEAIIGKQRQDKGYGRYSPGGSAQPPEVVFAVPVFTTG